MSNIIKNTAVYTFITAAMALGVGCIGEPIEDAEDIEHTGDAFSDAATDDAGSGDVEDTLASDAEAPTADGTKVDCGQSKTIYTNGTEDDRCISVSVSKMCTGNTPPRVSDQRGHRYDLDGGPVDLLIKAGNKATGHCNGSINDEGCCIFEVGPPVGQCADDIEEEAPADFD